MARRSTTERIERRLTLHLRTEAELGIFLSPRNARLRLVKARKHFLGVVSDGRDDAHPGDHNPPHDSLASIVVFVVMRSAQARALLEQADLQILRAIDNLVIDRKPSVGDTEHQL